MTAPTRLLTPGRRAYLERRHREVCEDMRELEAVCAREGGFLTTDWRCLRLRALGDEMDEIDRALDEDELARDDGF